LPVSDTKRGRERTASTKRTYAEWSGGEGGEREGPLKKKGGVKGRLQRFGGPEKKLGKDGG